MNIKRFYAATAREALAKARMTFGDGTVILSNRTTPDGVEVVATAEESLTSLEQQASDHGSEVLASLRKVLVAYGQTIMRDSEGIADALGFDALCDHLSISPAHREQARRDGGDYGATLKGLAFIARMEDSNTKHSEEWGAGGPLFEACMAAMSEFIRTCPENLLPDPFAPGEVFGPKLPPQLRVV